MYPSVDAAVDSFIEYTKKNGPGLEVLGRETASLHDLPAVRAIVRYRDRATGQIMIQDSITAFRTEVFKGVTEGILYTVGLSTPEARYAQDKMIYDDIVRSWRTQRVTE